MTIQEAIIKADFSKEYVHRAGTKAGYCIKLSHGQVVERRIDIEGNMTKWPESFKLTTIDILANDWTISILKKKHHTSQSTRVHLVSMEKPV